MRLNPFAAALATSCTLVLSACGGSPALLGGQAASMNGATGQMPAMLYRTQAASMNGAAGQMPAFYEDRQVTVNMKELPDNASAATIAHNKSINTIYAYADLDEPQPFEPVIDAIQGEGFNPLWQQVLIEFNAGFTPRQFTSEDQVLAAAAAGEITLDTTDEVYRCSVVGPKK